MTEWRLYSPPEVDPDPSPDIEDLLDDLDSPTQPEWEIYTPPIKRRKRHGQART